ncbi:glycosyltransferase [Altericista sp. CCNU0014]|uniref:glycosyltransferase n=1 Tax=Altericista sp. CCNU0014 TaxID=3082949 RepID=UPI00384D11F2
MFAPSYWKRYFEVFEEVKIVARVRPVAEASPDWVRVNTDRISVEPLPHYIGPWEYLLRRQRVLNSARNAFTVGDAVLFYSASPPALALRNKLRASAYPYGVYIIADPYDVFSPGAVRSKLRPFFRWSVPRQLRSLCYGASAAAYITEAALQKQYPPSPAAYTDHYSMAELPEDTFVEQPKTFAPDRTSWMLVTVGAMSQLYKAQDILIEAIARCTQQGLDLKLVFVGDGQYRPMLEKQAAELGIGDRCLFLGALTAGAAVRQQLDRADLFVLPSRQEGLPRAMLEAMARGLPCLGSTVGGMPELLPSEDLVPPVDVSALAAKIREMVSDPQRLSEMSARNLHRAQDFREDCIQDRRTAFYRALRQQTEAWLSQHP